MLEAFIIVEAGILAILGVMELISLAIARQNPEDPVYVFCSTFWREFLWPPVVIPGDAGTVGMDRSPGPSRAASARPKADETSDDDAFYGRFKKDESGRTAKVELIVLVEPHAAADTVLGRDGDGIKIQVIGEAGESRSNKALIEMVANAVGVKPFQVTLTKGHYQPVKTVQLQGVTADELEMKLAALADVE